MSIIKKLRGKTPIFGKGCWMAETATIIGNVETGDSCTFWYNTVVRADVCAIKLGNNVNVQDGVIIHGTYGAADVLIGNNVSIGHRAIVHGCTIEDQVLIGMGAIIMDDVKIEKEVIIAAGAVVSAGTIVQSGAVYAGVPARKIKDLDPSNSKIIERIANNYPKYASWYKE